MVDDTPDNIKILNELLSGFKRQVATNGETALKIAEGENQPDLILLDIEIPIKESYSICRELRESPQTKDIKVIIIKNDNNPMDKSWAVLKGAEFYMATKNPFSKENLIESRTNFKNNYRLLPICCLDISFNKKKIQPKSAKSLFLLVPGTRIELVQR